MEERLAYDETIELPVSQLDPFKDDLPLLQGADFPKVDFGGPGRLIRNYYILVTTQPTLTSPI